MADRRTLVCQCCRPPCTSSHCPTCPVCRNEVCKDQYCTKPIEAPHPKLLPKTWRDVQTYFCLNCRHSCAPCGEVKGKDGHTESMWHHRFEADRRTLCLRCCRPPCTSKQCKTCLGCWDPGCKRRKCDDAIKPLHPKQLPKTLRDLETYLCRPCRYITCQCGTQMSKTMQKKKKGSLGQEVYVCIDCQNKELWKKRTKVKVISKIH